MIAVLVVFLLIIASRYRNINKRHRWGAMRDLCFETWSVLSKNEFSSLACEESIFKRRFITWRQIISAGIHSFIFVFIQWGNALVVRCLERLKSQTMVHFAVQQRTRGQLQGKTRQLYFHSLLQRILVRYLTNIIQGYKSFNHATPPSSNYICNAYHRWRDIRWTMARRSPWRNGPLGNSWWWSLWRRLSQ